MRTVGSRGVRFAEVLAFILLFVPPVLIADRTGASSQKKWPRHIGLLARGHSEPELALQNGRNLLEDREEEGGRWRTSWPTGLARGDFNGDGLLDILISYARVGGGELALRFGNGRGDFTAPLRIPLTGQEPSALLVEDFDQDGALDVAVGYADQLVISIYLGTGRGTLQWKEDIRLGLTVSGLAVGDFNRDGALDLLASASDSPLLAFLPGDRRGGFQSAWFFSLRAEEAVFGLGEIQVADVDADGWLDAIVLCQGGASGVAILYGMEGGKFSYPQFLSVGVALEGLVVGDFDQDKRLDIAVTDAANGTVFVLRGQAKRVFSLPVSFRVGSDPGPLTLANLNNDGYPDLALVERGSNSVSILLGNADGTFDLSMSYDVDGPPVAIVAGRFRSSALDDLVVAKQGGTTVAVALNAPPTIVVTTTADEVRQDGRVSLREAILAANGNPPNSDVPSGREKAPDVIGFNLPEAEKSGGVFRIRVSAELGPLPPLADGGTTIDGTTQGGFSGTPIIVLDGSQAGAVDGVTITSSLNVVRGLVIVGFGGAGIRIVGGERPVTGNIIAGCYIGTDASGQRPQGNGLAGILLSGDSVSYTLIGGTAEADRNVISGNGSDGIAVQGLARNTQIVGNYIGVAADGRTSVPNGGSGVFLAGVDNVIVGGAAAGAGNVISGNLRHGLQVRGSTGVLIQGNVMGVDARGTSVVKNGGDGILLVDVLNAQIGGVSSSARNVISGNEGQGVTLLRSSASKIQGNYIGTDAEGRRALGNGGAGIHVDLNSPNNLIGGIIEGAGNVISGNRGSGIFIGSNSPGTQIFGNLIGVTAEGRTTLGNGGDGITINGGGNHQIGSGESVARNIISGNAGDGVKILNAADNRLVGNAIGTDAGGTIPLPNGGSGVLILSTEGSASRNTVLQNVIAYNRGAGVRIAGSGIGNRLSQNLIFQNEGLGIDRGGQGVIPQITAITKNSDGTVTVRGIFPALAPAGAVIEVYLADPDPSGRGEGRTFLGSAEADARGNFSLTVPGRSDGEWITVTATDFRGDTSEFSQNFIVDLIAPTVKVVLPNGGEAIRSGTTFCISWTASDNVGVVTTEVWLSTDSGATFSQIGATSAAEQRFCWNVPRGLFTTQARIRIVAQDAAGNRGEDDSDADFTVDPNAPVVTILIPNGGEVLPGSSRFRILWSALGTIASCDVLLSTDSGESYTALATNLPGTQSSYLWMPGTISTRQGRIRVVCTDTQNRRAVDDSDADFTVDSTPPQVTVLTPNGGEVIRAGSRFRIQWQSSDDLQVASHDLLLSLDGLKSFAPLPDAAGQKTSGLPGDQQFFDWEVPFDLQTTQGRVCVRARDVAGNELQDCNDANFTILQVQPSVRVLSPNGGEILTGGSRVTIRWTVSDGIVEQEILLSLDGGASFPLTIASGLSGSAQSFDWTVPTTLSTRQGRIRVIAQDAAGRIATDDSDGDFIIDSRSPTVRVIVPNGGEVFRGGDTFRILWEASDDVRVISQLVQLSTDGGANYETIARLDGEARSFEWLVPRTLFTTAGRIRVIAQDEAGKASQDDSDGDFVITPDEVEPPAVRVISPNGGERIAAESTFMIRWESTDNVAVAYCDVLLSTDGGATFNAIALRLRGNPQSYEWVVPDIETTQAQVGVRCQDYAGNYSQDASDFNFTIYRVVPSVRVVAPNGGEVILGGSTYTIRWASSDGVVSQDILLSLDGGATFPIVIASGLAAEVQSYEWSVPTTVSTARGRIRVVAYNARGHFGWDDSDGDFIIDSRSPTVRVIVPNGGEVFRGGDVFEILWEASDDTRVVRQTIQLSTDGGATYTDIVTLDGDDPTAFRWKVPLTLVTERGRIRVVVEDIAGKVSQDASDADFSVLPAENEPPFVQVLSPNGGEILCAGTPFRVLWRVSDNTAVQFQDILLSANGGATFNPIVERLPGTAQSYDWNIRAGISTTQAVLAVRVRDYAGNVALDTSDDPFAIDGVLPTISGVTVGTGSAFVAGERVVISWTSGDDVQIAGHTVELSRDGGATWELLANLPGDASQFIWTIPRGIRTTNGRIRVTVRDTCGRTAQAVSGRFSIVF